MRRMIGRPAIRLRAALLAAALFAFVLPAQPPTPELLNSERIEQAFGSYGIEVLANGRAERVSRLYSVHDGIEICRSFAVVIYPERLAPALAPEHEAIVAGGSIGATFAAAGWAVRKTHRYFGTLSATDGLRAIMHAPAAGELAVHVYTLSVARDGVEHEYATIAEVHHPDYLDLDALQAIHGEGMTLPAPLDAATRRVLERVVARLP